MRRFPKHGSTKEQLDWLLAFDFMWVCRQFFKITSKNGNKIIDFEFNLGQMWVWWVMKNQMDHGLAVRLWILKGRQFGISTMFAAYLYWKSAMHGHNALILPHKETPGRTMFRKVERIHNYVKKLSLDDGAKLVGTPISHHAGKEMVWESEDYQGQILMEPADGNEPGVSSTFQHIHATEVPVWEDPVEVFGRLFPTLPDTPDTTFVGEFTARAEGDYTHGVWLDAERGDSWLQGIFLPWYWKEEYREKKTDTDPDLTYDERQYVKMVADIGHEYPLEPGTLKLKKWAQEIYDRKGRIDPDDCARGYKLSTDQMIWRRKQIAKFRGDMRQWREEFPATPAEAFQSASRKLVDPTVMDSLDTNSKKVDIMDRGEYTARRGRGGKAVRKWEEISTGRVFRWERPVAGTLYVVSCDTSSGTSVDFSAAHVWRVEKEMIHLAASFRGKVRPAEFAAILSRMGSHYRTWAEWSQTREGFIDPKQGLPSQIVVERNHHGEWVIYELKQNLGYRRLYKHDERGKTRRWKQQDKYGFPTSWQTKVPMLLNMTQLIHDERVIIPCDMTRAEIRGMTYLDDPTKSASTIPKIGAVPGAFDDMAMSAGIGLWAASRVGRFRGNSIAKDNYRLRDIMFDTTGR